MARHPPLMISTAASERLELFLVTGVLTVLLIRAFLALTNYPQVGGSGLHIAHMLWGGIALSLALLLAVSALGRRPFTVAAAVGGIGFGFFIDEIGKFVTTDNDYFFRPAIALIYLAFVALALIARIVSTRPLHPDAALANALDLIGTERQHGFDEATRTRILSLLDRAPAEAAVVPALRAAIAAEPIVSPAAMGRYAQVRLGLASRYAALAGTTLFRRLVIVYGVVFILATVPLLVLSGLRPFTDVVGDASPYGLASGSAAGVVIVLTGVGTWRLARGRRVSGFQWLRYATVVSMLIAQPVAFWNQEFAALPGFVVSLLAYTALGYAIHREQEAAQAPIDSPPGR